MGAYGVSQGALGLQAAFQCLMQGRSVTPLECSVRGVKETRWTREVDGDSLVPMEIKEKAGGFGPHSSFEEGDLSPPLEGPFGGGKRDAVDRKAGLVMKRW